MAEEACAQIPLEPKAHFPSRIPLPRPYSGDLILSLALRVSQVFGAFLPSIY